MGVAVIFLAGGRGTRMGSRTKNLPKPMVPIGDKPILEHLLEWFTAYGHTNFFVAAGYRMADIESWAPAAEARARERVAADFAAIGDQRGELTGPDEVTVTVVDTGLDTQTGKRLRICLERLPKETHLVTYGDGLGTVDLAQLLEFHVSHGKLATVTAVQPPARFGRLQLEGNTVVTFGEKVQELEGWINGGFFVIEPGVKSFLTDRDVPFEREPLEALASGGELMAFRHSGFWHPMDTERDHEVLESLWADGKAPWSPASQCSSPIHKEVNA